MRESFGGDSAALHPLQAIVSDRGGGAEPFIHIAWIEIDTAGRLVRVGAPDSREAVGLQLHPH
jgi:hypothetical protein